MQPRAGLDELAEQRARVEHVLEVVDHQQGVHAAEATHEGVLVALARLRRRLHGPCQRAGYVGGAGHAREVGDMDAVGEPVRERAGGLDGHARLADAARPGQRHQPPVGEHAGERLEVCLAADRGRRRRWRAVGRTARAQRGVVAEDRPLELTQRGSRLEAQLGVEPVLRVAVDGQRLDVPARGVQRPHPLLDEPLAQRRLLRSALELGQHRVRAAQLQIGVVARLHSVPAQLLEPGDRRLRERLVAQVGQHVAAPQRERSAQKLRRLGGAPSASARRPCSSSASKRSASSSPAPTRS